jgi:hypothetical protein
LSTPSAVNGEVTQNLCVGVHRDRWFRNRVLDQVYYRPDRAVAPNPGVDVEPVLHHALRAREMDAGQQALLCIAALLLYIPGALDGLILYYVMLGWSFAVLIVVTIRGGVESNSTERKLKVTQIFRPDPLQQSILGGIAGLAVLTAIAMAIRSGQAPETEWVQNYATGQYEAVVVEQETNAAAAWAWGSVIVLVCFIFGIAKAHVFRTIRKRPVLGPDRRAEVIAKHANGSHVLTHSADGLPFVGSGFEITTWQFALALHPSEVEGGRKGEASLKDFSAVPLIARVREAIGGLGSPEMGSARIPHLRVEDQVFVSGKEVPAPVYRIRDLAKAGKALHSLEEVQKDPSTSVRHYLRCQVDSWDGELVTSVFVHCALQGATLFVEFSSFVLPPTRGEYEVNPESAEFGSDALALGAFKNAALTPIAFGRSVFDTVVSIVRGIVNSMRYEQGTSVGGAGDCGARTSIRQLGTGDREHNYFQYRDSVKYTEILERQILQTITVYLREAGIDTAELGERVTAIVNYGVINYGRFSAGAVGTGAAANIGAMGDGSRGSASGGR